MASKFTLLFFMCCFSLSLGDNEDLMSSVEEKIERKFGEYSNNLANRFKSLNDKHLVKSKVGRMLHYEELERKVDKAANVEGRNLKKFGSILPIIFFLGMKSALMLLTTLLAAKSVAIGLTLLVLKIAVGSAKLASYFTAWKLHMEPHYEYVPHYDHHGHKRSLRSIESHAVHPEKHYSPELSHHDLSSHYRQDTSPYYAQEYDYSEHPQKAEEKKYSIRGSRKGI